MTDGLASWGRAALIEDAASCVTELSSNAALHSDSRYFEVALDELPESVRITVEDQSKVSVDTVVRRVHGAFSTDEAPSIDDFETTGRGLVIVASLAASWGVDETAEGKRIWAELAQPATEHAVRPPRRDPAGTDAPASEPLPHGWAVVRLVGCPVDLILRQDRHLDELIRELQLMGMRPGNGPIAQLVAELEDLLQRGAHARHKIRGAALEAASAGRDFVDIALPMPTEVWRDVTALNRAVAQADMLGEQLLTLASTPDIRSVRDWMTDEFVRQLHRNEPPASYVDWLDTTGA